MERQPAVSAQERLVLRWRGKNKEGSTDVGIKAEGVQEKVKERG